MNSFGQWNVSKSEIRRRGSMRSGLLKARGQECKGFLMGNAWKIQGKGVRSRQGNLQAALQARYPWGQQEERYIRRTGEEGALIVVQHWESLGQGQQVLQMQIAYKVVPGWGERARPWEPLWAASCSGILTWIGTEQQILKVPVAGGYQTSSLLTAGSLWKWDLSSTSPRLLHMKELWSPVPDSPAARTLEAYVEELHSPSAWIPKSLHQAGPHPHWSCDMSKKKLLLCLSPWDVRIVLP